MVIPDVSQQLIAATVLQVQIQQQQVKHPSSGHGDGFRHVRGHAGYRHDRLQLCTHDMTVDRVIIDDQCPCIRQ